jgi:hypothetical protein
MPPIVYFEFSLGMVPCRRGFGYLQEVVFMGFFFVISKPFPNAKTILSRFKANLFRKEFKRFL